MHRWATVVRCSVNAVDNDPDGLLDLFDDDRCVAELSPPVSGSRPGWLARSR
jgi:hypothetical protein